MSKLTKRSLDAAVAPNTGQVFLWDKELRGFGVRVSTGAKTFILQYRNAEGRTRRLTLGRYGVFTVEQAREQAKIKLGLVASGKDPAQEKSDLRHATNVADVCDWYLTEAKSGRLLGRLRKPIKQSTLKNDESRIAQHILPLLGKRVVARLKLGDIESAQADIASGKTLRPKRLGRGGNTTGGEGVASRTMSTLHAIFEHARRRGLIDNNPAHGVRRIRIGTRIRRLSRLEITRLGTVLRECEASGEHPAAIAAIRLLMLTGFRRMEVLGLEQTWFNEEEGSIYFPDTKTGPQIRVIGREAVKLLAGLPKTRSVYCFPADIGEGHFVGLPRIATRVFSRAGLDDVTLHTLRHTFASVAGDLGFTEVTIAALLGHASRGITQRYIHINDALRAAADRVAEEIGALLDTRAVSADAKNVNRERKAQEELLVS